MLVSVMKLLQLAYCNCIYVGLLYPFIIVTFSIMWTKLHSSYHLFSCSEYLIWGNFVGEM